MSERKTCGFGRELESDWVIGPSTVSLYHKPNVCRKIKEGKMFKAVNLIMLGLFLVLALALGLAGCSPANSISQPASAPPTTTPQPGTLPESASVPDSGTVSESETVPETGTLQPF